MDLNEKLAQEWGVYLGIGLTKEQVQMMRSLEQASTTTDSVSEVSYASTYRYCAEYLD